MLGTGLRYKCPYKVKLIPSKSQPRKLIAPLVSITEVFATKFLIAKACKGKFASNIQCPSPNCTTILARETGAIWRLGAIWRGLLYYAMVKRRVPR